MRGGVGGVRGRPGADLVSFRKDDASVLSFGSRLSTTKA
jgi:hypothetical protein